MLQRSPLLPTLLALGQGGTAPCPLPALGGLGRWASPGLAPGVWEEAGGCRVLGLFPSLEARVPHRDLSHRGSVATTDSAVPGGRLHVCLARRLCTLFPGLDRNLL